MTTLTSIEVRHRTPSSHTRQQAPVSPRRRAQRLRPSRRELALEVRLDRPEHAVPDGGVNPVVPADFRVMHVVEGWRHEPAGEAGRWTPAPGDLPPHWGEEADSEAVHGGGRCGVEEG